MKKQERIIDESLQERRRFIDQTAATVDGMMEGKERKEKKRKESQDPNSSPIFVLCLGSVLLFLQVVDSDASRSSSSSSSHQHREEALQIFRDRLSANSRNVYAALGMDDDDDEEEEEEEEKKKKKDMNTANSCKNETAEHQRWS